MSNQTGILILILLGLTLVITGCADSNSEDSQADTDFPTPRATATLPASVIPGPDCLDPEGRHSEFVELIRTHLTNPASMEVVSTRIDPYDSQVSGYPIVVTFFAKDDSGDESVHTAIGDVSPYTCVANLTDLF